MISFFIPIRKNSKRVKNKNTKKIGKYSMGLTELKINQIKKFRKITKHHKALKNEKFEFVISSDDKKVLNFLKKFNWIRSHKRSAAFSSDDSLDKLINLVPKLCNGDIILWTHVTSPFFNEKNYLKLIKIFLKNNKKYKSAFTANLIKKFIYNSDKRKWVSHNYMKKKWPRTQDLDNYYIANSAAFISQKYIYKKYNDRIDKKPLPINISFEESFDIDDKYDFQELKKRLKK